MHKGTLLGLTIAFLSLFHASLFGADTPELRFRKIIGDMRGKGMENLSVAVADNGAIYLLMRSGRVAIFNADGTYRESRQVALSSPPDQHYLAGVGQRVFLGDYRQDYPWVYSPQRRGAAPGVFNTPAGIAFDPSGQIFVGDYGNQRIQIFFAGDTKTPAQIVFLPAKPVALAVRDRSLAVLTDQQSLILYERNEGVYAFIASAWVGSAARTVAIGPDGTLLVAFNGGPDRHQLKRYKRQGNSLAELALIAPSYMEGWPNGFFTDGPMVEGPDGNIWYANRQMGKVLSLTPGSDAIRVRLSGLIQPLAIGFDPESRVYVGVDGPRILRFSADTEEPTWQPFPETASLYDNPNVPVWGLLPDADGGVYVRVLEEGYNKGWTALTIKKVYSSGMMKTFLDFGHLYGVRTLFHPTAAAYSLEFDRAGNIILTAMPLVAIIKVAPDGHILWEAGRTPREGADKIDFATPRDSALDSKGNIWVIDSGRNKLFCLSPGGKHLFEYGEHANVDDTKGKGFDSPTGVAIAQINSKEYLYVGDTGNQRIVKYELIW